jgi:hypothetical protein
MSVVYKHIRKDTNEVFYVGIGLTEERASSHYNRTKHWHHIVNKVGYTVEITHRDIIWEEACSIEKYLISFYGRRDLGEGTLVNLTDGGEGVPGMKHSAETKALLGEQNKTPEKMVKVMENLKKAQTPEAREKARRNRDYSFCKDPAVIAKRKANTDYKKIASKIDYDKSAESKRIAVLQYDLNMNFIKEWRSGIDAANELNINYKSLNLVLRGKTKSSGGFFWKYKDIVIEKKDHDKVRGEKMKIPVIQLTKDGIFVREWNSAIDASAELNIDKTSIAKCCNDKRPSAGGYVWKYNSSQIIHNQ